MASDVLNMEMLCFLDLCNGIVLKDGLIKRSVLFVDWMLVWLCIPVFIQDLVPLIYEY